MYQIELRPGWQWDRNFVEFNKSMSDEKGNINFNGPYCKVKEWVDLSRDIGLDYHVFEIKWHDGICWWNTKTTKWTADRDYAEEFAELSRSSQIPFMYYYSAVFDHNPQFDSIQPAREILPSFIGNNKDYQKYLIKHFDEIMNQYRPDGMWFDWWWADGSTETTYKYFQEKYPETVMTFNMSNLMPGSYRKIQITSGEAHRYDGKWVVIRKEASGGFPVFTSSRKWANAFRWIFDHQWEMVAGSGSARRSAGNYQAGGNGSCLRRQDLHRCNFNDGWPYFSGSDQTALYAGRMVQATQGIFYQRGARSLCLVSSFECQAQLKQFRCGRK
jgi:alpha-L-fucosidase